MKTTLGDVAGCDEAKEEVGELVEFLRDRANSSAWAVAFLAAC